ncbi:radical SAM protein [Thermophilibacter mediterraneus]|uniref:radical SAM protein n=1 Tax=Thermophilibacter mediterraneus TaxID=1871031 RepID=UPI0023545FC0|nr:radical SAM protein [Thermophilibacter mediterraneus]
MSSAPFPGPSGDPLPLSALDACRLCPRRCGARRSRGVAGRCGMTAQLRVARSALHFWEEPPISGESGSGAIFFSGCPLRCVFCQNHEISSGGFGVDVSTERLAEMMLELEGAGALNVNLVTPLHFAPQVRRAVLLARGAGLTLPVVCNTSGYELPEVVRALGDVVDAWLTDFKYADARLAGELSAAPDYPEVAARALSAMVESVRAAGGRELAEDGSMRRGVIVRHLVLPGHADDSCAVLDRVWELAGNEVDLSVMNQYTPNEACRRAGGDLARGISEEEYEIVLCHADDLGFERIWWQEGGTVSESFVPAFDATGVEGPELGAPPARDA